MLDANLLFSSITEVQQAVDGWLIDYNHADPTSHWAMCRRRRFGLGSLTRNSLVSICPFEREIYEGGRKRARNQGHLNLQSEIQIGHRDESRETRVNIGLATG